MRFFPVPQGEVIIGRASTAQIKLDEPHLSREHALLRNEADVRFWLEDCGSTSGVWVNGEPRDAGPLEGGELIRLGTVFLRFLREGLSDHEQDLPMSLQGMVTGPGFARTRHLLNRGADSDLSVLIKGETGTGKELAARHLHAAGKRRQGPFVPVNCSAIPAELFESELFGHLKGAFTGATSNKPGLICQAHTGTLFLDEIGEMAPAGQAKLLRVIQERRVFPVGSSEGVPVDLHLVCATNRNLKSDMASDIFRADLFARIAELRIRLPPLRERYEDVPLLVQAFLDKHGGGRPLEVEVTALEKLCLAPWPMNIRQLESALRRAIFESEADCESGAALTSSDGIRLLDHHFAEELGGRTSHMAISPDSASSESQATKMAPPEEERMRTRIVAALQAHGGNATSAARDLGISRRSQLYRRAQKVGIRVASYRN